MNQKINFFGRARKETKLSVLQSLETQDLLGIPEIVFQRILKETGEGAPRERTRRLPLLQATGNSWNSEVTEIYRTSGGKIYFLVYHQLSGTDTYLTASFSEFMTLRDWRGMSMERDRWGGETPRYTVYTPDQKAEVIREVIRTFLSKRYPT